MSAPAHQWRIVRIVFSIIVLRHFNGKPFSQIAFILRIECIRRIFGMSGDKELTSVTCHCHVNTRIIRLGQQGEVFHLQDIFPTHFGVTAVRHKKHIIEPTEDRQSLHIDMVFKNAEHLFIQRILRHSIEVIKSGLCCPADIKCGSDMSTRPVKNGRDFVPISHLLVRHLLNGSAGHNHAVIRFIAHQVKIAIECFHVLHRRIL